MGVDAASLPVLTPGRRRGFEHLDDPATPAALRERSLRDVRRANRLLGGTHAVLREVARILPLLGGAGTILDVGTGSGVLALEALARWPAAHIFGADASSGMLGMARVRAARAGRPSDDPNLRWLHAPADRLPPQWANMIDDVSGTDRPIVSITPRWTGQFDAVLNLFTSFGFFAHPRDDAKVIHEFARVLKPGGVLLWHGGSRDGVVSRFISRDWWTSNDGTMIGHERSFDPLSGFLTVRTTVKGKARAIERSHQIRLYTATRLAELCADAGLVVEQAWEGWKDRPLGRKSSEMLLLARKDE